MATMVQKIQPAFSSSIAQMTLKGNQLTKVPSGMTGFTRLTNLDLSSNAITSVATGELALPANVIMIDLHNNSITTVAPGAFPSTINNSLA
jgi:Leucine-rich repeat (LRR) protein